MKSYSAVPARILVRVTLAASVLALHASSQTSLDWIATHPDSSSDQGITAFAVGADGSQYLATQILGAQGVSNFDVRLVKISGAGALEWTREWDTYGFDDLASALLVAPNGDVFVAGTDRRETSTGAINFDATLRKLSPAGTQTWFAASQGFGSTAVSFLALARLSNGAVIGAGRKGTAGHLARVSDAGVLEWQRTLPGGLGGTFLTDVAVLPDDSIIACGRRGTQFNGALAVWRFDAAGVEQWVTLLDENVAQQSSGLALDVTSAGRAVVGGWRRLGTENDMALAQFDLADGSLDWKLYVDLSSTGLDEIRTVSAAPDGSIWCAGRRHDPASDMDTVVLRVDDGGAVLSLKTWAGGAAIHDQPQSLELGSAGQAWVTVMAGDASRDIAVLQFDSTGELSSADVIDLGGDDIGARAALGPGGKLAVGGLTNSGGDYDLLALQLDLNDAPTGFCTAKLNSLGCAPQLGFSGASSASAASGFELLCSQVRNQKAGLLIYSLSGPDATPFQGGYLCVAAPRRRTPVTNSGGSASGDDCSGVFAFDLNAFASGALGGAPAPELSNPGASVHCQQWSRDPGSLANSGLSSGLRYVVGP